jgi:hypothetical protein
MNVRSHKTPANFNIAFHADSGDGSAKNNQPSDTKLKVRKIPANWKSLWLESDVARAENRARANSLQRFWMNNPHPCHNPHTMKLTVTPCHNPINTIVATCETRIVTHNETGLDVERMARVSGLKK